MLAFNPRLLEIGRRQEDEIRILLPRWREHISVNTLCSSYSLNLLLYILFSLHFPLEEFSHRNFCLKFLKELFSDSKISLNGSFRIFRGIPISVKLDNHQFFDNNFDISKSDISFDERNIKK